MKKKSIRLLSVLLAAVLVGSLLTIGAGAVPAPHLEIGGTPLTNIHEDQSGEHWEWYGDNFELVLEKEFNQTITGNVTPWIYAEGISLAELAPMTDLPAGYMYERLCPITWKTDEHIALKPPVDGAYDKLMAGYSLGCEVEIDDGYELNLSDCRILVDGEPPKSEYYVYYESDKQIIYVDAPAEAHELTVYLNTVVRTEIEDETEVEKTTVTFPYTETVSAGDMPVYQENGGQVFSGRAYEFESDKDQVLYADVITAVHDTDSDVTVDFYEQLEDGSYRSVFFIDQDNSGYYGERFYMPLEKDKTYLLILRFEPVFDQNWNVELTALEKDLFDHPELDLTMNPTPGKNDLWAWNAETKVLTLKDGFKWYGGAGRDGYAVILPEDATVNVEGKAEIYSAGNGIYMESGKIHLNEGAELALDTIGTAILDTDIRVCCFAMSAGPETEKPEKPKIIIEGTDSEKCTLSIPKSESGVALETADLEMKNIRLQTADISYNAVEVDGDLTAENCILDVDSYSDGLKAASGALRLDHCQLQICCGEEAAYVRRGASLQFHDCKGTVRSDSNCGLKSSGGAMVLDECDLEIDTEEQCLKQRDDGEIIIKNSELNLHSPYYECIYSEDGDVTIEDSKVVGLASDDQGISAEEGNLTVKNSVLSLASYSAVLLADEIKITGSQLDLWRINELNYPPLEACTVSIEGDLIHWDSALKEAYRGPLNKELFEEREQLLEDRMIVGLSTVSPLPNLDDNRIEGVKPDYIQGDLVKFKAVCGEEIELPISGCLRYVPADWELEQLNGILETPEGEADTAELPLNENTLKVRFWLEKYNRITGWKPETEEREDLPLLDEKAVAFMLKEKPAEKPVEKPDEIPDTGRGSSAALALALISLAGAVSVLHRKK